MGFFNFFKPEWQHSNADVRKNAVIRLKANADQGAIENVAQNDQSNEIRGIAIRKLNSIEVLQKIASAETDESNKRDAKNRLLERIADHLKNFREAATPFELGLVSEIANTRFADDLLKSMPNSELRLAMVRESTRQSALEFVALKDAKENVAMAALEGVVRSNMLQNIFQNSRHTTVRQKAGELLRSKQNSEKDSEKNDTVLLFQKRDAIIQQAQRLADAKDFMTNKPAFDKLLETAKELGMGPAEADLNRVIESYHKRRDEEQARIDKAKAESEAKSEKQKQLENTISEMDRLIEENVQANKEKIEALIAKFQELNENAENAIAGLFKMSVARFKQFTDQEAEKAEISTNREEILAQLKLLAEADDTSKSAEHKIKALIRSWEEQPAAEGDDPNLQAYNALRSKLAEKFQAQREADEKIFKENSEKLQAIIEEIQQIDENGNFKEISQKLRDTYKRWKEIVGENKFRYKESWQKYQEATSRFKEMQEWEAWHNEHDRESILDSIVALAKEEPSKEMLLKLRHFTNLWRSVGPVSSARLTEFREKFRTLFEEIMAKCEPILKEQEEERKQNLVAKEEICQQVEALASEDDANWRDKYKVMQELQEKWKAIGLVPKDNVQPIWDRFRAAENAFFAKHKEFVKQEDVLREDNFQKKSALCERAEALSESSDWNAVSKEFRDLQEAWKKIGPVPRSKSEEIWNRFRSACDQFFNRKRSHFEEMDAVKIKNLEAKEALCAKLESLDGNPENPETAKAFADAAEEWKAIGMVPKDKVEEVRNRYGEILNRYASKRAEIDPEFKKAVEEAKQKKESMVTTISELLDSAGSNQSAEVVKNLQNEWGTLPRCGVEEQELYDRFRSVCDDFFNRRRDQLDIQEQARENNLQNKIRLCEEAERLVENLNDENRRDAQNEVKQLRKHWREIGAVPRKDSDKIWKRFNSACDTIFGNSQNEKPQEEPQNSEG